MTHTEEQWQTLNAKLARLQAENQQLRKELQDNTNWNNEQYDLIRSSVQPPRIRTEKCPHCMLTPEKSRKQLVEQFQMWSHRLNNNFIIKKPQNELNSQKEDSAIKQDLVIQLPDSPRQINLFEKICLFGPSEEDVIKSQITKLNVPHQLYFPEHDQNLQVYGNYLYPERVTAKIIRDKNKLVQIDRIIFRKSLKPTDCQVFIFQCQQEYQGDSKINNPLCKKLNPFRSLFNVALEFNDYLFSDQPFRGKVQHSTSMMDDRGNSIQEVEQESGTNNKNIQKESHIVYGSNSIYKSSFRLCVMTYFPFINFFCELLIHIIDQIKIKRIQQHSNQQQKYHLLDIKYVIRELQKILRELTPILKSFTVKEDASLSLKFGQQTMFLQLDKSKLKNQLSSGWAFKMLQLMDKQVLYDIYCLMMLEQSICFVCENSHILTFFIYLFVQLLVKPFSYPHPIVSIVFQDDLLETPFTAILGINKDNKWLEDNQSFISEKMEGKIIVNLNGEVIKIRSNKKVRLPKSERLKKIFSNFYKRADKVISSFKKKEILMRQTTLAQNEIAYNLIQQIQAYYEQQIICFMPNREIIDSIRNSIALDNQTAVNTKLIKDIEQYVKQSRKRAQNQPFINLFMQKQIFYVYLTNSYDIV